MSEMSEKIKARREELHMTLEEVGNIVGVGKSTVRKWETGQIENMRRDKIAALAMALNVSPGYLMGWEELPDTPFPSNVTPLPKMEQIPLVGRIACGIPITAEENIEDYIDLPGHIKADFALSCKGDSMIRAGIQDGDIVYIREQPEVENGQIAAVMIDGDEATLKRFYRSGDTVTLVAENPSVSPFVFSESEINRLRVIGLAIAFTHVLQ